SEVLRIVQGGGCRRRGRARRGYSGGLRGIGARGRAVGRGRERRIGWAAGEQIVAGQTCSRRSDGGAALEIITARAAALRMACGSGQDQQAGQYAVHVVQSSALLISP